MTVGTAEAIGDGKESQASHSPRGTRKIRAGQASAPEAQRFFLAKPGNNSVPELSKEFTAEAEAMVESLKTGLSYFVVSEWRGIADFSGRKPQLGREAVPGRPKGGL
ncbi:MAG TPA: hypothetical protein VFW94_00195 [Candidatus Acidoferrales bacterium]|nr:hypothetical protein [Candidatus Acidoferrales bacterium]